MADDDILTQVYKDIESAASRASTSVKNLIADTSKLKGLGGTAFAVGMGGLNVAGTMGSFGSSVAGGKGLTSSYTDAVKEIRKSELELKTFGYTIEGFGKKLSSLKESWGTYTKEAGASMRQNASFVADFGKMAETMAAKSGILAKSLGTLGQGFKIALGPIGTATLVATIAYEQFVTKTIKLSDELIKKQKEVASAVQSATGMTSTQAGVAAGTAGAQGYYSGLGSRQTALQAVQLGSQVGMGTQVSLQIANIANSVAQAQGKALEPVLKDMLMKASMSFAGKTEAQRRDMLTEARLASGPIVQAPGMGQTYTDSMTRIGRGFGVARDTMFGRQGQLGTIGRAIAGPRQEFSENPISDMLYDALMPKMFKPGGTSILGGLTSKILSPIESMSKGVGLYTARNTEKFGSNLEGIGNFLSQRGFGDRGGYLQNLGIEQQVRGTAGRASIRQGESETKIGKISAILEQNELLKEYDKLGKNTEELEKKRAEAYKKAKTLQTKALIPKTKEEQDVFDKEVEENRAIISDTSKGIQKFKTAGSKYGLPERVLTSSEISKYEKEREDERKKAQILADQQRIAEPLGNLIGNFRPTVEGGVDYKAVAGKFTTESIKYTKNKKRIQELENKIQSGKATQKEKEEYDRLNRQSGAYEQEWLNPGEEESARIQTLSSERDELTKQFEDRRKAGKSTSHITSQIAQREKEIAAIKKGKGTSVIDKLSMQQQADVMTAKTSMQGFFKGGEISDIRTSIEGMFATGMLGAEDKESMLAFMGGVDPEQMKQMFKSGNIEGLRGLALPHMDEKDFNKAIEGQDINSILASVSEKVSPADMQKAQMSLRLKGAEFQRKQAGMESQYMPAEREMSSKFMESGVKSLQDIGKITGNEIQKITDLLAKKDQLSIAEAGKIIGLAEKRYQLEEATLNLQLKQSGRASDRVGLGISISSSATLGYIGGEEAKRLGDLTKGMGNEGFDKAQPIVQNILSTQERMYQQELQFTVRYTEARMDIIKQHYDKATSLERLKVEGADRRIAPFSQYGQGIANAYQPMMSAISGKFSAMEGMRGDTISARGLGEQRQDLMYQMAGIGVPEHIQQQRALRSQKEAEENFSRQIIQQKKMDTASLGIYGDVFGKLSEKGIDYNKLAETESGRSLLQNQLLQNQGAFARETGTDVTPMIQGLVGRQVEHEGRKVDMEVFDRKNTGEMYNKQIAAMEEEMAKNPKIAKEAGFSLSAKYGEAAEYFKSIGDSDSYKALKGKQIESSERLPAHLQNIKDAGQAAMVVELERSNSLLSIIATVTGKMAGIEVTPEAAGMIGENGSPFGGSSVSVGKSEFEESLKETAKLLNEGATKIANTTITVKVEKDGSPGKHQTDFRNV